MKYQVQIKYTNPMHDHVTLRRRVESITRLVEAASEQEALNRATNQQRALGFMIKEAAVMKGPAEENKHVNDKESKKKKVVGDDNEKTDIAIAGGVKEAAGGTESYPLLKKGEKLKPMKIGEGFDPEPKDIAAHLVGKHGKGKVTKDHVDAYEKDRDSNRAIDKEAVMKHVQKMSEEVEQVDEMDKSQPSSDRGGESSGDPYAKGSKATPVKTKDVVKDALRSLKKQYDKKQGVAEEVEPVEESVATAQKVMDRAKVVANTNPDPKKRFAASGLAQKAMLRTINPTGVNTGITRGGGNKTYRMVTGKVPPYQLTKKTGVSEEVVTEASKEGKDVMRNMRASMKAMDLRHGVDSDKRDAGYKMSPAVKAAQAKSDALSKVVKRPQAGTLAAVHKSMERTMERSMKKEAVEDHSKKKARTAAEKMVNRARGNANKVNVTPEIDPGKPNA